MVQLWSVIGLIVAAICVSVLGAVFSIFGLGKLFSGAMVAIWLMALALELAKFFIAAFLHQVWSRLNVLYKTYLFAAVIVLSVITSMGIFGFLSNAYQESSNILEAENIKLTSLKGELAQNNLEIDRINKSLNEIPQSRITQKMKARAAAEPRLQVLDQNTMRINRDITNANLKILDVKNKVGPLIYIARAFNMDIDTVVKYLILLIVCVFDPLAISLVIAVSESMRLKKLEAGLSTETVGQILKMRFAPEEMKKAE